MSDMKQIALRVPDDLAEKIDARVDKVGVSRNEWLVRALTWAVEQPVTKRRREEEV